MNVSALVISSQKPDLISKTRLDSHAVSPVVGYNAYIWRDTGKTAGVAGFTKSTGVLEDIPIVDAIVHYECPISQKQYLLMIYNALYIPANEDNLLTPFLVREAGVRLNETPKIQVVEPSVEDHALYFPDDDLRIHLQLAGIVSYFCTRKPTADEIESLPRIDMTPNSPTWDPYNTIYARQEECMLDFEGNIIQQPDRDQMILNIRDIPDDGDEMEYEICRFDQAVSNTIDMICDYNPVMEFDYYEPELYCDGDNDMANALNDRVALTKFATKLGVMIPDYEHVIGAVHHDKPKGITPERLAKVFRIDEATAKRTIGVTSQKVKRIRHPTLDKEFSTNDRVLRYRRIKDHFFMDTLLAKKNVGTSRRGNTCMQLFVTDKGYVFVVAMKRRSEVHKAVKLFMKRIGIPDAIIGDGAKEFLGATKKVCNEYGTTLRQLERGTPWSNRAELYIGLLKRAIKKDLKESNCPLVLWDYCAERRAKVHNVTAKDLFQLQGQTPSYHVHGVEPDISNICQFAWYEWVYFRDGNQQFPLPTEVLGRALGPADNAGSEMCQWVLKINGQIVPRRTCRPLKEEEIHSPAEVKKRQRFEEAIRSTMGDSIAPPVDVERQRLMNEPVDDVLEMYEDEEEPARVMPDADDNEYDKLISAELHLPHGDEMMNATVVRRSRNIDGDKVGTEHDNIALDTRVYDVVFDDGTIKQYAANVIAENMYSQIDLDGRHHLLMEEILEHRSNEQAVTQDNKYVVTKRGEKKLRKTTIGWEFRVLWRDGSSQWISLKELKESNPVEIADYVQANNLTNEPAFAWWVPYTIRKRDMIIAAVNKRVEKSTHKFGIKVPRNVKEAIALDRLNQNTLWQDAIKKEMSNVMVAFEILEDDKELPPGYTKASGHIIFDVKMDFTRKARYVKDGHKTPDPEGSRYAGVVSRESVRIALTYAALNDLDVMTADIRNAYLQAAPTEKHYIICGAEFGIENIGKRALIVRALYGGKTSGRDFRNALRSCMSHINFKSCLADPDVWMRKAIKSDGTEYYEYVLLYVDDALCISVNGESVLRDEIGKYFALKEESVGQPDIYLGGKISKVQLENGANAWSFSSSQYVKEAVKNVESELGKTNSKLPAKALTPLSANYRPETDTSPELDAEGAAYFQSLIGVARWIVELGRVDVCLEVSMLSSHLAMPREGHMQELLHLFAYLKRNHNSEMVFDPSDTIIDPDQFERQDWEATEFGNLSEELPGNMPIPRGQGFTMTAYVDADHAGDTITRRSRTGFIVFLNCAPIYWYSKKQNSVETSSFGSEFMAMKHCTEYVRGLRYKLRMMGIPCELPTFIYGDNKSVLSNTSVPDSVLKKKSNSIAYHFVREGCAKDEWRMAYINTHDNPADLLTKPLSSGEKRMGFIRMVLHHIFGGGHEE